MDAVSYSLASKQAQRIKKFIENPDSASGIVTVPSTVAAGETITVPAGRVAVLPNTTVNGTLVIDGEVFVPSGSSVSTTEVDATVVKQNGNVVANDSTVVHKIGDETIAGVKTFSNNAFFKGNVGIGEGTPTSSGGLRFFDIYNTEQTSNSSGAIMRLITRNSAGTSDTAVDFIKYKSGYFAINNNDTAGTISLAIAGAERFKIDSSGNVLITGSGGLGYGAGSGGAVTQLTSKSTAVTLNKPCGSITMNNASLAAGAFVTFVLNNSIISSTDGIIITQNDIGTYIGANYDIKVVYKINGLVLFYVKNISASTLSDAVNFRFDIIKGVTA